MKILYVEDNDDNIYMLRNRLMRAGYTVVIATDGAKAWHWQQANSPTLC